MRRLLLGTLTLVATWINPAHGDDPKPGESIVVCGEKIAIGTPVILWTDPGGHNAYNRKPTPAPAPASDAPAEKKANAPGFGLRRHNLSEAQLAQVQQSGWTRPLLEQAVDQFVIHYDVCGTSQRCFDVLQQRNLSVHFMLDLDGTLYQTLDLKEAAYHATKANGRSIGIEIANMGAYPLAEETTSPLSVWYKKDDAGRTRIELPTTARVPTLAPGAEPLRPSRDEPVVGMVQGQKLTQYDLTPQQYAALAKLSKALCTTFPQIRPELPRDEQGQVVNHQLDDTTYKNYHGILGHFHVQLNKTDPGPAFQWDQVMRAVQPTQGP